LKLIDGELARLIPNNRRVVLAGATHHLFYEQPEKCQSVIQEFLASINQCPDPATTASRTLLARWRIITACMVN
jgi:hypothetical protein